VQRGAAEALVNEEVAHEQVDAVTDGHAMLMIMLCLWLMIILVFIMLVTLTVIWVVSNEKKSCSVWVLCWC